MNVTVASVKVNANAYKKKKKNLLDITTQK